MKNKMEVAVGLEPTKLVLQTSASTASASFWFLLILEYWRQRMVKIEVKPSSKNRFKPDGETITVWINPEDETAFKSNIAAVESLLTQTGHADLIPLLGQNVGGLVNNNNYWTADRKWNPKRQHPPAS